MHIAIIAPSHKSFISNFLPNINFDLLPEGYFGAPFIGTLINELLERNHTITAITTTKAINGDYTIKKYNHLNFTWIIIPFRPHSFRFNNNKLGRIVDFYKYEQKKILNTISDLNPDFIHAHWSYEFAGPAVNSGIPYLVTIHDNAFEVFRYFKNMYRLGRLIMSEHILRKVKYASTVSPYMLDYVNKRCKSTYVIPNPTVIKINKDDLEFKLISKINSLNSPRILMISNFCDASKNGKIGLLAFQQFQNKFPDASLNLYGSGTEENGLVHKEVKLLKIKNVFFNGPIPHEELLEVFNKSHLLIHPSLEESFGVVLIEAMSYGVPVIGGLKSGAVPWVINNQQLLIDVTIYEEMAIKMIDIMTNTSLYKNLAIKCYNNVTDRFSSNEVVVSYLDYYEEIISNK
jgi:glycosyltransferase involved in cell wall biosynthesis